MKSMPSIRTANYRHEVSDALENSRAVDAAVAFASNEGLNFANIRAKLEHLLRNDGSARILVDLQLGNTHPDFLEQILDWRNENLDIQCCHYESANGLFHPKLYIFHFKDGSKRAITGSANWTGEAYSVNIEHGVVLDGSTTEPILTEMQIVFEKLWSSQNAKDITSEVLQAYRPYWRKWRGLDSRSRRRTSGTWQRVESRLAAQIQQPEFRWPDRDAAFLLGAITARGSIDIERSLVTIALRYGGTRYSHNGQRGYIGKGNIAFEAASVVPLIPQAIADRIRLAIYPTIPAITPRSRSYEIRIDCQDNQKLLDELKKFFGSSASYQQFRVPRQILTADKEHQEDFIRGYGLTCALVSSGTYGPGIARQEQIWLRPTTQNERQFDQIADMLEKSFGIVTYKHRRKDRDVHLKVRCGDWLDIGFGVDWLDSIVEEGARLNGALAPPQVP